MEEIVLQITFLIVGGEKGWLWIGEINIEGGKHTEKKSKTIIPQNPDSIKQKMHQYAVS